MTPESRHDWKIQRLERKVRADPTADQLLDLAEACFQKAYYYEAGAEWYDRAAEVAEHSIDLHGHTSRACALLANVAFGAEDLDEAERWYAAAIQLDATNALAHVGLGNLHQHQGNLGRAIDAFDEATRLDADLWQAHHNLGSALFGRAKEASFRDCEEVMERAIYHLVTALRLRPFDAFVANIYRDLGELFLHTGQLKHAQRFFTRLVQDDRHEAMAHYYLGLTAFSMEKYLAAIQHYRSFLEHEPESPLAWSRIGLAWVELRDWDRAREACEAALDGSPDDTLARYVLATVDLEESLYRPAEERLEVLLHEDPGHFQAWRSLVQSHYQRGDFGWLFDRLRAEIRAFEEGDGFDGGRLWYRGERGRARRRVDALLTQIQEMGVDAFGDLSAVASEVGDDSLRFQIWESLYDLSRQHRVAELSERLADPGRHFCAELGRTTLLLSQFLPEEVITDAFHIDEESLRRRARDLHPGGSELDDYKDALEQARAQAREHQAHLLLALALKGSPSAEDFLTEHVDSDHDELRAAAAIALLFYGSEAAVQYLAEEAEELDDAHADQLRELIELGRSRGHKQDKVIELGTVERRSVRRPAPSPAVSCSICGRDEAQVDRLMSGNRSYVCNICVSYIHHRRSELRAAASEDLVCSFCRCSTFDTDAMYEANGQILCSGCLDTCVRLLAREEVERFVRSFS